MNNILFCIDVYTVTEGDTLYSIAEKYDLPVSLLMKVNGISDPYNLLIGTRLCIPGDISQLPEGMRPDIQARQEAQHVHAPQNMHEHHAAQEAQQAQQEAQAQQASQMQAQQAEQSRQPGGVLGQVKQLQQQPAELHQNEQAGYHQTAGEDLDELFHETPLQTGEKGTSCAVFLNDAVPKYTGFLLLFLLL